MSRILLFAVAQAPLILPTGIVPTYTSALAISNGRFTCAP